MKTRTRISIIALLAGLAAWIAWLNRDQSDDKTLEFFYLSEFDGHTVYNNLGRQIGFLQGCSTLGITALLYVSDETITFNLKDVQITFNLKDVQITDSIEGVRITDGQTTVYIK